MYTLDSVNCADQYSTANLGPAYQGSGGGYAAVSGNDAYMQISYGTQGQARFLKEMHVPVGTLTIPRLPRGSYIQFRNYIAGSVAVVSGALAEAQEPAIVLGAGGISNTTAASVITGIIPAAGTTPTAGSGFTYTHTNGTGLYVFTFTTAFAATPLVLASPVTANRNNGVWVISQATTGCSIQTGTVGGVVGDVAFNFTAQTVT